MRYERGSKEERKDAKAGRKVKQRRREGKMEDMKARKEGRRGLRRRIWKQCSKREMYGSKQGQTEVRKITQKDRRICRTEMNEVLM